MLDRLRIRLLGSGLLAAVTGLGDRLQGGVPESAVRQDRPLVFVDAEGRSRPVIGELEPGVFGIRVFSAASGRPRLEVGLGQNGDAAICLREEDGLPVSGMVVTSKSWWLALFGCVCIVAAIFEWRWWLDSTRVPTRYARLTNAVLGLAMLVVGVAGILVVECGLF
jgi:hypothetical protein